MTVVAKTRRGSQLFVIVAGIMHNAIQRIGIVIATQRIQHALTDSHGVCAHGKGFGYVGTGAYTAGDDELYFAFHVQVFQRIDCLT